jgi:hypothetical protein
MLAAVALGLGFVFLIVGVGLLSVPVALIVTGVLLMSAALLTDFDSFGRRRP